MPRFNTDGVYYLTFTIKNWYYIFDRHNRWEILTESLSYRIEMEQIDLYAYVLMLNHMHLIVDAKDITAFIRDYKKYTSKRIKESLEAKEPKVLGLFENSKGEFELWQKTNMPIQIFNERTLIQKIRYIIENPVRKKYVNRPEYWKWSSANPKPQVKLSGKW